ERETNDGEAREALCDDLPVQHRGFLLGRAVPPARSGAVHRECQVDFATTEPDGATRNRRVSWPTCDLAAQTIGHVAEALPPQRGVPAALGVAASEPKRQPCRRKEH